MADAPILFDRAAVSRNRARATKAGLFLHAATADEVEERLKEVNRSFSSPAVVTGHPAHWSRFGPVVADDDMLALATGAHDLILHGLSLHWANDPVGQLIQCRRALAPDGLFLGTMLGGETLHELRACLGEAEAAVTGGLSPRVAPMAEIRDLGALLQRAGFALPVADSARIRVEYATLWRLMRDLRAMGETNALTQRLRRPTRRSVFTEAARIYSERFAAQSGRIEATYEVIYLTAWCPSEDQPKPLRPGSATARLADALGVPERNPEESQT